MFLKEEKVVRAFNTLREYFEILKRQREQSALAEEKVLNLIEDNLQGNILDAGCGEGSLCRWMAKKSKSATIYGMDISIIGIGMAMKSFTGLDNLKFCQANVKNLPFKDNFFSLVVCQSVIEHVVDYIAALKELVRVLRRGGNLILRTGNNRLPGQSSLSFLLGCILGTNRSLEINPTLALRPGNIEDHRHNFDVNVLPSDVLVKQLKQLGLKVVYFTTRRWQIKLADKYKDFGILKKWIINILCALPFFPFTHLGGTIIIMARKP